MSNTFQNIVKPDGLIYHHLDTYSNSGEVIIQPLEPGYGITLGNALRRVMLSSTEGAAIVALRIGGVTHEFTSVAGIKEDVVVIVLNLQLVVLKLRDDCEKKVISLSLKGPMIVTAAVIASEDVEVLNPDVILFNITSDVIIEIDMLCRVGRGYVPSDLIKADELGFGAIAIGSTFNPVKKVSYSVRGTGFGYDQLTISIETNGAITLEYAVSSAIGILQEQFNACLPNHVSHTKVASSLVESSSKSAMHRILWTTIGDLELSVRASNCLSSAGIAYVGDLVMRTEDEILQIKNFGAKTLHEVKQKLQDMQLKLGTTNIEWPVSSDGPQPSTKI